MHRRPLGIAPTALLALVASCAGISTSSPYDRAPRPGFSISPLSHTPYAGTSIPLRLRGGERSPDADVMWSTDPYRRAWVTSDGVAHFFEPGRVRVIARRDGTTAITELEIQPNPVAELVARREHERPLHPGDSLRISATAFDASGAEVTDLRPTFAIDLRGEDEVRGRITDDGLFVAERPGLVTILVEANGHASSIPVFVRPRPAPPVVAARRSATDTAPSRAHRLAPIVVTPAEARRVRISTGDFSAYTGTAIRLEARVWMEGASSPDTAAQVTWESSDPSIAMIDVDGVVTFRRRGWVRLTARHGDVSHSRRLLVRENPVAHIVLQSNARYPRVGQKVKLRDEAWMRGGTPVPHARTYLGVVSEHGEAPNAIITENRELIAREPGVYTVIAVLGDRASKTTFVVYPAGRRCELMLRRWDPSCRK